MESPVLNVSETAEYLRVPKSTVYVLVRSDEFPAIKIGKQWRVVKQELDEWLKKKCAKK